MLGRVSLLNHVGLDHGDHSLNKKNGELRTTVIVQSVLGPLGENAECFLKGVKFEWTLNDRLLTQKLLIAYYGVGSTIEDDCDLRERNDGIL